MTQSKFSKTQFKWINELRSPLFCFFHATSKGRGNQFCNHFAQVWSNQSDCCKHKYCCDARVCCCVMDASVLTPWVHCVNRAVKDVLFYPFHLACKRCLFGVVKSSIFPVFPSGSFVVKCWKEAAKWSWSSCKSGAQSTHIPQPLTIKSTLVLFSNNAPKIILMKQLQQNCRKDSLLVNVLFLLWKKLMTIDCIKSNVLL